MAGAIPSTTLQCAYMDKSKDTFLSSGGGITGAAENVTLATLLHTRDYPV